MRYSVGGCISIIETWLENDLPESPEELVQIINYKSNDKTLILNFKKIYKI